MQPSCSGVNKGKYLSKTIRITKEYVFGDQYNFIVERNEQINKMKCNLKIAYSYI